MSVDELIFEMKPFDELTLYELNDLFHLRDLVFVVGQKITAECEVDGKDPLCQHALLWRGGVLLGTARIFHKQTPAVVGRVAIHNEHQKQGLGTVLMQKIQARLGDQPAMLHAQAHLEKWYTALGWCREGAVFMEAEIPHVTMRRG